MAANDASEGPMLPTNETLTSAGSVTPPRPDLPFERTDSSRSRVAGCPIG